MIATTPAVGPGGVEKLRATFMDGVDRCTTGIIGEQTRAGHKSVDDRCRGQRLNH